MLGRLTRLGIAVLLASALLPMVATTAYSADLFFSEYVEGGTLGDWIRDRRLGGQEQPQGHPGTPPSLDEEDDPTGGEERRGRREEERNHEDGGWSHAG